DDGQGQALAVERAAEDGQVGAQLGDDVLDHAVVGGRGGAEDRYAARQPLEDAHDPPVVGPEVVPPVADAVGLVDHQQPDPGGEGGQDLVAEAVVVEAFGRDEQDVDRVGLQLSSDAVPLLVVRAVDGLGPDAQAG